MPLRRNALRRWRRAFNSAKGGRLWLSGLPKQVEAPNFPPVTLQIICLPGSPESRGGVTLPGAFPVHMPIGGLEEHVGGAAADVGGW